MQNTNSLFFTWDDGTTCRLCKIGLYSIGPPWKSYIPVTRHFGKCASLLCHGSNPGLWSVRSFQKQIQPTWKPIFDCGDHLLFKPSSVWKVELTACCRCQQQIIIIKKNKSWKRSPGARRVSQGARWPPITCSLSVRSHRGTKLSTHGNSVKCARTWQIHFRQRLSK